MLHLPYIVPPYWESSSVTIVGYSSNNCKTLILSEEDCCLLCLVTQSWPTLHDPMDCSPPDSSVCGDSPGKNTGVGCHFLLQCMKMKSDCQVAQSCPTLHDPMDCSLPGSSVHGDPPGNNIGVGFHALLQGIFPTQGLNPGLPTLQLDSLPSGPPWKLNVDLSSHNIRAVS